MGWTDLIKIAVPVVVDFFGGDKPAKDDKTTDDKENLVTKPIAGELEERKKIEPWTSMRDFSSIDSRMAGPVGATPALKTASPSELNSRYWAAIYEDAKRRSEIR